MAATPPLKIVSPKMKQTVLQSVLDPKLGLGYNPVDKMWHSRSGMNYSFVFAYEKKFYEVDFFMEYFDWSEEYWPMCIVYSILYVILIHAGQRYMKDRPRFDMRKGLAAWNILLALFSITGTLRLIPEFVFTVQRHGFVHSFCNPDFAHGVSGCWIAFFVGSKFAELLDTFWIVIRKQKLIFLHWYHHTTVLIYCWYATHDVSSTGRNFAIINFSVHSIMYSYYACRALRFNVPKWVMMTITGGQITQMVVGVVINCWAFWIKTHGGECFVSYDNLRLCFFIYFTYLFLFSYFFYCTYLKKGGKKTAAGGDSAGSVASDMLAEIFNKKSD